MELEKILAAIMSYVEVLPSIVRDISALWGSERNLHMSERA